MSDFRPINLYSILYKIIVKVIANRLNGVLPNILSDSQSVFVLRHQISDNILIVYELIHFLRRKKKGKQGYMSIKLGMSKACDRVEWNYLEKVMMVMGFKPSFIWSIMSCVSSASFSMLVNDSLKGHIIPLRGLRQRDLLFPYLFLLCTEGLISLLSNSNHELHILGIQVCRGAPSINHLLFVDDNVLFL